MQPSIVYQAQQQLERAREDHSLLHDEIYYSLSPQDRARVDLLNHPQIVASNRRIGELETKVAGLQDEIGGKVYRVVSDKLEDLKKKVEKITKRAAKLELDPPALTVTDEHDIDEKGSFATEFTYVVIAGNEPKLAGWTFIASLDHQENGTAIRRIPASTYLLRYARELSETAAEEFVASIDLDAYRHAPNKCDHCGYIRNRLATFVVLHEDGRKMQVGSSCIKDFLGGNNPHQIAKYAEYLMELDEDLGDEDGFFGAGGASERLVRTDEFLAHAVTMIRHDGYRKRDWDGAGTADAAVQNLKLMERNKTDKQGRPLYHVPSDEDADKADKVIAWVKDHLGSQERPSEFEHNLHLYVSAEYLPNKGVGFAGYAPVAYDRFREKEVKYQAQREKVADSEYVGTVGDRLALTLRVESVKPTGSRSYGYDDVTTFVTKFHDADGNCFVWFASRELELGKSYSMTATVKKHEEDSYNADAKTTYITRCLKIQEVAGEDEVVPKVEATVVKSAAERKAEKEKRELKREEERLLLETVTPEERAAYVKMIDDNRKEGTAVQWPLSGFVRWYRAEHGDPDFSEIIDGLRAALNDVTNVLNDRDLPGWDRDRLKKEEETITRRLNLLEGRLSLNA